ncbi:MAG: hypothetical protein J5I47_04680 [Vicingus serpentipes]|nr:hypothetical protein [Vicingus serpentipes]
MAGINEQKVWIGYYYPGKTIEIPVDFVKNTGDSIVTGVQVLVTYDDTKLSYNTSALDQGTYVDGTTTWTIGTLVKKQSVGGFFYFDVIDDCVDQYTITFDVTSTGCDSCLSDNTLCILTEGVSCCAMSNCSNPKSQEITALTHDVALTDDILEANAASNTVQFNLPTLASAYNATTNRGKQFTFKVSDFTNSVSIVADGSEKILVNTNLAGASSTHTFTAVGESLTIVPSETLTHWISI